ncbi:beta-glucosidase family protein [Cyanobium gracile]|uniref:Glycoside hydrolase family 3 C-terminal domain-containing protein n=1 Tax=Cyanobium gracile UHCC 0281 TaxID=3110309 RepID=A0ABU5SRK3_9CYAN|nr:glycoside hydrolase family 3 C-terminal domain-containing protein [Cyanobium gracile]MEA5441128.1 glycoside hydrolase family 3 C-terminal domain-containing protein [Cyanobium gracile UHCC 0281]
MPICRDWSHLEKQARTLLDGLSLDEKLSLLDGDTPFWGGLAGIALHDTSHRRPWPAGVLGRLGIAGLHFVDGPRGVVLEGGATTFPAPIGRGASWDVDLEERIGAAMGQEARSFGANLLGGICVNLLRHPGWGRAQETFGEDPLHVGAMGAASSRGVQRHAIACVKHFALNSIDSARFRVDVSASERALHELYLPGFRDCIEAGALAVMSAYNSVNGAWCGQHPHLLQEILKQRWGFRGFVLSDFIFGIRDGEAAITAGQDLEMPFRMIFQATLPAAVAAGRVPMARIDDAVLRLLLAQGTVPRGAYPESLRGCREHQELAREAATKTIVLLRNSGGVLPLNGIGSLAVIGPLADTANLGDRGSSDTRPAPGSVVTPLAGLRAAAPDLRLHHDDGSDPAGAAALAARSDAALVVVGLDWRHEGEHIHPGDLAPILRQAPPPDWLLRLCGRRRLLPLWTAGAAMVAGATRFGSARAGGSFASGDRTVLQLPPRQEALILAVAAANPRTVVVLMGGGAILCEAWRQRVPGLLMLWYPGEQGGAALADVLLGRISPSGRMPFSVPTEAGHLPPFDPRARRITYDLWHGYRRLARLGQAAAFPFGFGLSYSTFTHSDPMAQWFRGALQLSVTVANTGPMAAAEVIQVYAEPPGQAAERPRRSLVGFRRLSLQPGQRERVEIQIPLRRLAWFDASRDAFVLEGGRHRLVVARHAEDEGISVDLSLEAGVVGR